MSKAPEILAPAGSWESLLAALRCGADAVYVGAKSFSARQNAENFDSTQLRDAIRLCHLYGAKLYLTINTLIFDSEFPQLEALVKEAASFGVDALLVQDFGVLHRLKQIAPDVPIHASTQMTIHTPAGAAWAKDQGMTRVVVSRELSRAEIAAICAVGMEVEQFVHGALCMSVSGQCGLSAVIGSRSANRGRCAQACRLPFSACGNSASCALSLKDLCLVPYVSEMTKAGVASLKIEGRCKRPEYVAAAVTALVQARNGIQPDLETLKAVFSRSGFTDGYYTGMRTDMFGTRQKEDVLGAKEVLPKLEQLYRKPPAFVGLTMHVTLCQGKETVLELTDSQGNHCMVYGEIPQTAKTKPTDAQQLERQLGKLGGTIYHLVHLSASCDGVSMLPASALNALRRAGVQAMDKVRIQANTPVYALQAASPFFKNPDNCIYPTRFRVQLSAWSDSGVSILEHNSVEAIVLPITTDLEAVPASARTQVFLDLPRFCPKEEDLITWLEQAKALGFSHILCENASHILLGKKLGFVLHGGLGLNCTNSSCLAFLREEQLADTMLSPELTIQQINGCTGLPFGIYAYGMQPVMTMRNCSIQGEVGCRNCGHRLTDRTGRQFPVYCNSKSGVTTLYNAVPTWMADKCQALSHGAFLLLDCTLAQDPLEILVAYEAKHHTTTPMTRGLFYRGVE